MEDYFQLEKPNLTGANKNKILDFLLTGDPFKKTRLFDFVDSVNEAEYLYWDKIRYKQSIPDGFSREELWLAVKSMRGLKAEETAIRNEAGNHFVWVKLKKLEKFCHETDMSTGGEIFVFKADHDRLTKQKLISRGVMEEAIASSQLEGASTSRAAAKRLLREGRKPKNISEQMIVNNYFAIKQLEENYKNQAMSFDLIRELHGIITEKTLTPEGDAPRMRKEGEDVFIVGNINGKIYHKAPKMSFVAKELERLVLFANDGFDDIFIHPIIKAIMLHFWMGYLHPFTDGNGRLARLLFYWYLLKNGYWAFSYIPISKILKKAPAQYSMAYAYSEQEESDMTYFIDFNIRKIKLAIDDFKKYVEHVSGANKKMNRLAGEEYSLNERQIQLLQYLQGDSEGRTSIKTHMNIYQISKKTAIGDLRRLASLGFLESKKTGRNIHYYGTEKIKKLF